MKKHFINTFYPFLIFVIVFVVSGAFFNNALYAQGSGETPGDGSGDNSSGGGPVTLVNPFKGSNSLFDLLKSIMNDIVLPIGGVLAVLAFIYSGFLYVTAQGDESQLKTAHKALLYTAIGTAVLLGSWVLANVICETIGQLGGPTCAT